jgi:hypothetical protein
MHVMHFGLNLMLFRNSKWDKNSERKGSV